MRTRTATAALAAVVAATAAISAAPAAQAASNTAPKITKASVGSLVFGTSTAQQTVRMSVTVSDNSGIKGALLSPWPSLLESELGYVPTAQDVREGGERASCKATSATTSVCTVALPLNARTHLGDNMFAGTWRLAVLGTAKDGGTVFKAKAAAFTIKRAAALTLDATPEPVAKGGTVTLNGRLNRADWATGHYVAFPKQAVKVQFRKDGAAAWTTLKTVTSAANGTVTATAKATATGTWRLSYDGVSTTHWAAGSDHVTVR